MAQGRATKVNSIIETVCAGEVDATPERCVEQQQDERLVVSRS
jgi:hypothetical protein